VKHSKKRSRKKSGSGVILICIILLILFLAVTIGAAVLAKSGAVDDILPSSETSVSSEEPSSSSQSSSSSEASSAPVFSEASSSSEVIEEEPEEEENLTAVQVFSRPAEMQAVLLQAGVDFCFGDDQSEDTVRTQIDNSIAKVQELTMNTIVIDPVMDGTFLFASAMENEDRFDPFAYLISKARAEGLYIYSIYDLARAAEYYGCYNESSYLNSEFVAAAASTSEIFAQCYDLDGVLLTGYYSLRSEAGYQSYLLEGGGIGYQEYLYDSTSQLLHETADALRHSSAQLQIGVLADPVWANAASHEDGSETNASFQSYFDGSVDLYGLIDEMLFDFIAVKNFSSVSDQETPFVPVAAWWTELADLYSLPCYLLQDSGSASSSTRQLTEQVIEAKKLTGYSGSIYNSLNGLVSGSGETGSGTSILVSYLNDNLEEEHILKRLAVTKPAQLTFSTYEPTVTFAGAGSPAFDITINGTSVEKDDNGYFSAQYDLEVGKNTFTIAQQDQSYTFTITRQIQIFAGDISPTGTVNVDGGMQITITADVYEGADVYATIGGTTVPMTIQETDDDSTDRDSSYPTFAGVYTAPAATSSSQQLGNVVIYASWNGFSESRTGASVTVNKKRILQDGVLAEITGSFVDTYPSNVLNELPQPGYYELPKGTMDYIVGDEVVYKSGGETYRYFNMASGLRIATTDLATVSSIDSIEENIIGGMEITGDDRYTTIRLATQYKVPYTIDYDQSKVKMTFHYTSVTPGNLDLPDSRLFSSAVWNSNVLTLTLNTKGGFMGLKSWYEDDILVLQFNNPAQISSSNNMSGTRIVIDPGHSITDPGALGFHPKYPEQVINYGIARQLKSILQDWGASVKMIDTQSSSVSLESRVAQAVSYEPHLFVSVHNNSSSNSSAKGTEVYYFNEFSSNLASKISAKVASSYNTTNRGARFGRFLVTTHNQFPSVLVECGFVSNKSEYEKLIKKSNQYDIAEGIANGIFNYLKAAGSDNKGDDFTVSTGSMDPPGQASGSSGGSTTSKAPDPSIIVEDINFDIEELTLSAGETYRLYDNLVVDPVEATGNEKVTWESFDNSIATISQNGVITAVAPGTVRIRVLTTDRKYGDNVYVTVTKAKESNVEEIYLSDEEITLEVEDKHTLTVETYPDEDASVLWESSDPKVATVKNGAVIAVGEGTAVITATAIGTDLSAECVVEVVAGEPEPDYNTEEAPSLTLDCEWAQLEVGDYMVLEATVKPKSLAEKVELVWESSDEDVLLVDNDGYVYAEGHAGTAIITVYVKGRKELIDTCEFEIYEND